MNLVRAAGEIVILLEHRQQVVLYQQREVEWQFIQGTDLWDPDYFQVISAAFDRHTALGTRRRDLVAQTLNLAQAIFGVRTTRPDALPDLPPRISAEERQAICAPRQLHAPR